MTVEMIEFLVASLVVASLDLVLSVMSFRKGDRRGRTLGFTCIGCAIVDLSYLVTCFCDNAFAFSCVSSIYFLGVDFMLFWLVLFVLEFGRIKQTKMGKWHLKIAIAYMVFDAVVFALNPFLDFAIGFIPRNTSIAKFSYDMHGLFYAHLVFCYLMVAVVALTLIMRLVKVPLEYKRQYLYSLIGLSGIVAINGIFLFVPEFAKYSYLDLSIFGYSIGAYVFYWACFNYSTKGMMNLFKMSVFENLDQGLVLFDYSDKMILFNEMSDRQWPHVKFRRGMNLDEFMKACRIEIDPGLENCVLQCYVESEGEVKPLRCDFRTLKNRRGRMLGHLFMFSNAMLATDPLTGFHNWENFKFLHSEKKTIPRNEMVVVACDIMGLSFLNNTKGRHVGDLKIKALADLFRTHFPKDSFFIRGHDANFIVTQLLEDEKSAIENLEKIRAAFDVHIQYSIRTIPPSEDLLEGIEDVIKGLKQKKLLNKDSSHSVILNSLVQALQECDSDTEAHVQRTQEMGALLGKRIGLNDVQQSDLSLLCLLHDIGKIGVPLEILNKPGKLTADEWRVLRSHAVKGFQIANSSSELCGIANMILHHHERWDGAGYPDGLSRESIPLLSRVIAVVDAYDAMVNDRSYRAALPQDVAINELKRCAGSQFDPGIVSEFIQMIETMPKIEPKKVERPLEETKALVREELTEGELGTSFHAVHSLNFCRYVVDEKFNILSVDKFFENLTGYTQEEITNNRMNHLDLIPKEDRTEYLKLVLEETSKSPQAFFEHRLMRKDGTVVYVFCLGRQFFDSAARASRSEIFVTDVSNTYSLRVIADVERKRAKSRETEWENAFRRDPLTGVLTRAAFKNDTEFKLLEGQTKVMLLMVDVDHFKTYNDTYGHVAGDEFLTLVGQTLLSCLRRDDIAGRMGGDEFAAALFFKKTCTDEFMYERAQQIFDKINMTLAMNPKATSLSMGAVIADEQTSNFTDLYACADKRLYKSKEGGRSRISVS
ncbi:MAG: diguanylate cyclase [Fibrobacter sp.]|nr:diguanylate cyclase [Fibrobacter sp.]